MLPVVRVRQVLKKNVMAFVSAFSPMMINKKPNQSDTQESISPVRVLGAHEPCLNCSVYANPIAYPLLKGDSFSAQRGGIVLEGTALSDAKQFRSLRQFYGCEFPNTAKPIHSWKFEQRTSCVNLKGTWLFAGFKINHFGHFIADNCHRLWPLLLDKPPKIQGIVFVSFEKTEDTCECLTSYQSAILDHFIGNKIEVRIITRPTTVERLIVPSQASTLGPLSEPQDLYVNLLRKLDVKLSNLCEIKFNKVYVSRSKLKYEDALTSSRLIGEKVLEGILRKSGFHIFHPQEHTFKEQLAMYRASRQLIFCEGSSIHSLDLLGSLKANVILLSRGGLSGKRNRSLATSLRKRVSSLVIFRDITRHPSFQFIINSKGQKIPVHWNNSVWLSYEQLCRFLEKASVPASLVPSKDCYRKQMAPELFKYVLEVNKAVGEKDPVVSRAMKVLLNKIDSFMSV